MKKMLKMLGLGILGGIGMGILMISLPWILLGIGIASLPNPPEPEVKYGEFPFKLVYEVDGEQKL